MRKPTPTRHVPWRIASQLLHSIPILGLCHVRAFLASKRSVAAAEGRRVERDAHLATRCGRDRGRLLGRRWLGAVVALLSRSRWEGLVRGSGSGRSRERFVAAREKLVPVVTWVAATNVFV